MKKQPPSYGQHFDVEDAFAGFLDTAARGLFWLGLAATFIAVGFLLVTFNTFAQSGNAASAAQASSNIAILGKVGIVGVIGIVVGSTYMWWGEETLVAFLLGGSAIFWFAPLYVPNIFGAKGVSDVSSQAMASVQLIGTVMAIASIIVLISDITVRMRERIKTGSKADQLRFGKGVKEEPERMNVFMGKCYQLPFCRKFVREKCPIYHARKACWRERVGCMCEEEVIRGAMENRPIPKDVVAAAAYIPRNNKLSDEAKKERCRQCVIYNEHQKHKYKLFLPIVVLGILGVYAALRTPLLEATGGTIRSIDKVLGGLLYSSTSSVETTIKKAPMFQEVFLICLVVVCLAYTLKLLEYLIFRLKI